MFWNHVNVLKKKTLTFFYSLVISCGDPGALANGIQFGNDFTFNKTVSYQCNPGYLMEPAGASTMRCTKDSAWNQSKPICKGRLANTPWVLCSKFINLFFFNVRMFSVTTWKWNQNICVTFVFLLHIYQGIISPRTATLMIAVGLNYRLKCLEWSIHFPCCALLSWIRWPKYSEELLQPRSSIKEFLVSAVYSS